MSEPVGLITGSEPFAGLPTNPAQLVLPHLDGQVVAGHRIVAIATPVSYARLPTLLPELVARHRPAYVMALGLALGANVVRVEKFAINAAAFGVADNEGARPASGERFAADGPDGRAATWDAAAVVEAIMAQGIPARASYHAGTHLCNLTLYTYLAALEAAGAAAPCGFLHLPYLPEQIVWMIRRRGDAGDSAPTAPLDLPSMSFDMQLAAVRAAAGAIGRQAAQQGGTTQ
ncbi:MAG: peptidase [Alphaproteobacteria bacterium]